MGPEAVPYEGRTTAGTVREVVHDVTARVAREELPVVEGLARFGDATVVRRLGHRGGRRREPLGFGAGEATALVTGVVWLALDETVRQLGERAANGALRGARSLLRRVLRRQPEPATLPPLTPEQLVEVRQRVLEVAARRALERERAGTVADAVVARLAPGTPEAVPPAPRGESGGAANGGGAGGGPGEAVIVAATGHRTPPRVDERSMPSGTTLRFILLVVLIMVSSASMMMMTLGSGLSAGSSTSRTGSADGCTFAAGGDPSLIGGAIPQADTSAYRECLARYEPRGTSPWWVSEAWPVLMVVVAAVLVWAIPAWRARRGRVVPLEAVDGDGAVRGALRELATAAGLERVPRVVVDPAAASAGAVVFGSNRQPVVCLHGGLLVRARTDPEGFRAVLLHEFAHIRNGDVTLTYLTVALWRAFLGLVLLPYVALMLTLAVWMALFDLKVRAPLSPETMAGIDSFWPLLVRLLGLAAVLVLLVHLARADVLRSREVHADLTAVRWGAAPHHWAVHAAGPDAVAVPRGGVRQLRASFAELLRTHPRWDLRREALDDPAELFGVRALPMFLTGVAAPVINAQVWVYNGSRRIPLLDEASWAVTAALVAGVAGVALWRAVAHAVLTARREPSGVRAGLWLGAGMTTGELVAYQSGINTWLSGNPVMLLFPFAAGVAFSWWTAQCARLWTGARPGRIRPLLLLGSVAGAVVLTSWFAWWQGFGVTYAREGWPSVAEMRALLVHGLPPGQVAEQRGIVDGMSAVWIEMTDLNHWALSLTAVAALWLLPLAAWALRPAADGGTAPPQASLLPPLRRVLLPGLLGAALATLAVAVVMAYMHTWQPSPAGRGLLRLWIYLAWVLMLLLAAATAAAAAAAALTDRYRLLCAFIAAQTTVLAGFAGAFVLASLDGCVTPLNTLQSTCSLHPRASVLRGFHLIMGPIPVVAALAAAFAAAVVSVLHRGLTARRPRTALAPVPGRWQPARDHLLARRLCVGVLCAAALAVTATDLFNPAVSRSTVRDSAPGRDRTAVAPSPRTRALQVYSWEVYGGLRLERRFLAVNRGLGALVRNPHAIDESRTRAQCAQFRRFAHDAARYFPVPDPRSQSFWRRAQTYAVRGAAHCDRALDRARSHLPGSGHLLATALNEFTDAVESMGAMSVRNRTLVKRAGILE
ncbi:M48 family metalloprotease [Streptomyces lydicus]|uniref:M48 family metalloprotease n=1 Tax=Streptomyces lydicus TaxID=47763 RepID=UPI003799706F